MIFLNLKGIFQKCTIKKQFIEKVSLVQTYAWLKMSESVDIFMLLMLQIPSPIKLYQEFRMIAF